MLLKKGKRVTNGKREWVVAKVEEDREGYDLVWFHSSYGSIFGPMSMDEVTGSGYRVVPDDTRRPCRA
jgi:hypothetical protein